jgi:choline dehydrogenase-like flavoprotein
MPGRPWAIRAGPGMICCKCGYLPNCCYLGNLINRPFYKKTERFFEPTTTHQQQHEIHFDREFMGADGPLPVSFNKEYSASHQYWHETLNNLGAHTNKSHLSGSNVGVWTSAVAVNPETCTRAYSAASYYYSIAEKRSNLAVLANALVREVKIERVDDEWTAKGVKFSYDNQDYTIEASQEVILSAGSVSSPQLLELSGIGNPTVLQAAGIAVKIANSNVGENLQDHLCK